ncbi:MAG: phosphoglucosamine mutase [Bdellovibrionales bacterium]
MSTQKLFGTDGIRGRANSFPMTTDIVLKVGQALGHLLMQARTKEKEVVKVLIGKDTRLSGYMIEMALASGLNSMGVHVQLVGPLPTPGIGFLARNMRAHAGIIISASHNAFHDNGIKIFGSDGFKISGDFEKQIEDLVAIGDFEDLLPVSTEIGRSKRIDDSAGRYIVYAKDSFPIDSNLDGMRIALDTANGAAYKVAPQIFSELGAEVIQFGSEPNGFNINEDCGALHPESLAKKVQKYRADVGICLDGDADRVIMVDELGNIVNGDFILAICGMHLKEKGLLKDNTVVCTTMSNFGILKYFKENGINVVQTNVGDKYVVEEMRKGDYALGGEQSGHIIFLDSSTTGDGVIAALQVLSVMRDKGLTLSKLISDLHPTPQILKNLKVNSKPPLEDIPNFSRELGKVESELDGEGRVMVRYSGTESIVRVLVEGPSENQIEEYADRLGKVLLKELG